MGNKAGPMTSPPNQKHSGKHCLFRSCCRKARPLRSIVIINTEINEDIEHTSNEGSVNIGITTPQGSSRRPTKISEIFSQEQSFEDKEAKVFPGKKPIYLMGQRRSVDTPSTSGVRKVSKLLLGPTPYLQNRRISMEIVAQVAKENSSDGELPAECRQMLESERQKTLLRDSWKRINSKPPSLIDNCMRTSAMTFLNYSSTKKMFSFLENDEQGRFLMESACGIGHIHQTINVLSLAISHLDQESAMSKVLRKMGARHISYGVTATVYYQCFMEIMSFALKELVSVDYQCDEDLLNDWKIICDIIGFHTMMGARRMTDKASAWS